MKIFLSVLILIALVSCKEEKDHYWSDVTFDNKISANPSFKKMDKEEFASSYNNENLKRTSDIKYSNEILDRASGFATNYSPVNYGCTAYFDDKSDKLVIDIGLHGPFGGSGFSLNYFNGKFFANPYKYSDIPLENETEPIYKVIVQKLTLDKSHFQVGDSIYGLVNFRIIEIKDKISIGHTAKGFFRTKIAKE
ncbi:hypothetical protein [Dyadobacter sp. LHD-138]|uniref:hypothetical protein n=1 Tax=Dyadobacter sp. LHD-138 TaxID=3071413 RepID=UPI0027DEFC56|nr:hypothetical protein [Dyadobacter sp. LHD-138]MDQ6481927.1 hypothetical protein [Dyadobacter sp. LHD-138]